MGVPTALAPSAELAEPRVRRFVDRKLVPLLQRGEARDFYLCDPAVCQVENYAGDRWYEANWGVSVEADGFSLRDVPVIEALSDTIGVGDAVIEPCGDRVLIKLWLHARVLRY
jgi:hypothetical protein